MQVENFLLSFNAILLFSLLLVHISWYVLLAFSFFKKKERKRVRKYPLVSVLIPAYNEEKNIGKCIESVLGLEYPKSKLEIVVVDDGSVDSTYKVAKSYNVEVYRIKHKGKPSALNYGLKKCRGEYILILDADTLISKEFLREAISHFTENVGAVSASMNVWNDKKIIAIFQKVEYIFASLFKKALNSLDRGSLYIFGAATIYRAELLKKLKFKNVSTEDFDLAVRIQAQGYRTIQVDTFAYTKVPESIKSLYKQRIRWYSHALHLFKLYRLRFFKSLSSLSLYTLPLTYYWYFFAILSIPLTFYQIYYWIPRGIFEALFFLFRWFSFFGTLYNIYMLQFWQVNANLILGISISILNFFFIFLSLAYYKQLSLRTLTASLFIYPYFFFIVNFSLVFSLFIFFKNYLTNKLPHFGVLYQ